MRRWHGREAVPGLPEASNRSHALLSRHGLTVDGDWLRAGIRW